MKKHIYIAVILANLTFLSGFAVNQLAFSQSGTAGGTGSPTPAGSQEAAVNAPVDELETKCYREIKEFAEKEYSNYQTYIVGNFLNKSSTQYLLPQAMERYGKYTDDLNKLLSKYENEEHASTQQLEQLNRLGQCRDLVSKESLRAKELIEMQAKQMSAVKSGTIMNEKIGQINTNLRKLTVEAARMRSMLTTFSDKLPCYLRKNCLKR